MFFYWNVILLDWDHDLAFGMCIDKVHVEEELMFDTKVNILD